MAIQSACIPLPSEVIMPLAGYALAHNQTQLILLATIASLASNLGSIPAYWVGARGGSPHGRALRLLPPPQPSRPRPRRQVLRPLRFHYRPYRPHAADREDIYCLPRWRRQDEPVEVPHLHLSSAPGPGATPSPTSACASGLPSTPIHASRKSSIASISPSKPSSSPASSGTLSPTGRTASAPSPRDHVIKAVLNQGSLSPSASLRRYLGWRSCAAATSLFSRTQMTRGGSSRTLVASAQRRAPGSPDHLCLGDPPCVASLCFLRLPMCPASPPRPTRHPSLRVSTLFRTPP